MAKLKKGDTVFFINIKEKQPNKRLHHECIFDTVDNISGKKAKLKNNPNESFDDDGKHDTDTKKKLTKINQKFKEFFVTNLRKDFSNITSIKIDDNMLAAIEKETI